METAALMAANHEIRLMSSNDEENWRSLRHFNYYRLVLAMTLLLFFYNRVLDGFLGRLDPAAFLTVAIVFLTSSFFYILFSLKQQPNFKTQIILTNSSDIALVTLMMHFSGGLVSGLGMLLIINIAATGTFLQSRESYFFAAIASMGVLFEQTYSQLNDITSVNAYPAAGILGIVFFGSSMLASVLSQRLKESEALASQRKADLHSLEKLNEHIIQNMRTGIIVVDNEGHIQMANSSAESLLGEVSLKSHPLLENVFPALDARFLEWQDQPQMHQKPIRREQGLPDIQPGFRKLDDSSTNPGDSLIFLEDATQLNQRYQQMKLASLGRLTASIAHEIRNPLSAINHASQLLNESELDAADRKLTHIITTQVQRLDKIVQNVLSLSRQQQGKPEGLKLHDWLINFREEFIQIHGIGIEQFSIDIHPRDLCILFDSSHLYQVLNNLCTNIILHHDKKREDIRISLVADHDPQRDQPYLDIIDNGPGIEADQLEQIFDPFYTTNSKGTGLGLFISKEIIESNRGKIRYIENNNSGSCFRIYFLSV